MDTPRPPDLLGKNKTHAEHVVRLAKQLADGSRPGVLGTIDANGQPHLRWMATISLREFPRLYALTSPKSRKVEHVRANPKVNWMFTSEGATMVINLFGNATIVSDKNEVNRIWGLIENKSSAYFLSLNTAAEGIAVIETTIEDIECVVPRYDLHYPPRMDDFSLLHPEKAAAQ